MGLQKFLFNFNSINALSAALRDSSPWGGVLHRGDVPSVPVGAGLPFAGPARLCIRRSIRRLSALCPHLSGPRPRPSQPPPHHLARREAVEIVGIFGKSRS
jgi:hypothetical protein